MATFLALLIFGVWFRGCVGLLAGRWTACWRRRWLESSIRSRGEGPECRAVSRGLNHGRGRPQPSRRSDRTGGLARASTLPAVACKCVCA